MQAVVTQVLELGGQEPAPHPGCSPYLLELGRRVLINAGGGPGWEGLRQELAGAGRGIEILVLLSCHLDHAGAAARIQADTGCEVVAGGPDAAALAPVRVRPVLERESALDLPGGQLHLVRVPGITEGSLAAWIDLGDPTRRLLFARIHWPPGWNRGYSVDGHIEGLRALLRLEADILCDSHHGVRRGKDTVREHIESHLQSLGLSRAQGRAIEAWQRTHPGETYNP